LVRQSPGLRPVFFPDHHIGCRGRFDAVIHNAGVYRIPTGERSIDGLPLLFAVNSLAPYILTSLMCEQISGIRFRFINFGE
jgi:NAD(P)-dependent dehydrogenase (short-subunit alcohol dehydrogenase family)